MTEYTITPTAPCDIRVGDLLVNDHEGLATMHRVTSIRPTFDQVHFDIVHDETGIAGHVHFWRWERPEIAKEDAR